jgi:hypothetical protein
MAILPEWHRIPPERRYIDDSAKIKGGKPSEIEAD